MKHIEPITNLNVTVEAPPSKAHTLRALLLAALADGKSTIRKPLMADDQQHMIESLKRLGTNIDYDKNAQTITVDGTSGVFEPNSTELDVGESGVTANFLIAASCFANAPIVLTGAKRITERPVAALVDGLKQLGANIEYLAEEGFPPVRIHPSKLKRGKAKMSGAKSSQYFSSLSILGALAENEINIECIDELTEKPYLDITLQMMETFGVRAKNEQYETIRVPAPQTYKHRDYTVEGDFSSASFFFLAAAVNQSSVTVTNLLQNSAQGDKGFLNLLEKMGCSVNWDADRVTVVGRPLKAIEIDMSDMPDLVPPAAVAAAFADGTTRFTHVGHLRHKECDRLSVTSQELAKMGVESTVEEDALAVQGAKNVHGAEIDPHNDHRIAMSFAVAGLTCGSQTVKTPGCVAKSFPDFWERFEIFYQ